MALQKPRDGPDPGQHGPRQHARSGCNAGWYSRAAAAKGIRVIGLDTDETCVNRLFEAAAEGKLAIVPAIGDIGTALTLPGPTARERLAASQRFASELVLALAITHHLALSPPWLGFHEIAGLLAEYSMRYLLTEFVGFEPESENPYRSQDRPGSAGWYTLANFLKALQRHFREVILVPGPPGRRLVLAEK